MKIVSKMPEKEHDTKRELIFSVGMQPFSSLKGITDKNNNFVGVSGLFGGGKFMRKKDVRKKKYGAGVAAVCLTGVILLAGCGSGGETAYTPGDLDVNGETADTSGGVDINGEATDTPGGVDINGEATDAPDDSGSTGEAAGESGNPDVAGEDAAKYEAEQEDIAEKSEFSTDDGGGFSADMEEKRAMTGGYLESCYSYEWEPGQYSAEEYSRWEETGFVSVMAEPLSTFAADVDTASYSNLRRLIREGYTLEGIPEGAVRIEELLNYFDYDHKSPSKEEPFGVTTQIGRCPWNENADLLMIGLKTQDIDYAQAPPSNLVFLLDVSGSMDSYDKLPLLQEAFGLLAEHLTGRDRISVVTYAEDTRTVLDGVRGSETEKIVTTLNALSANGGTYGSKGIETAYALAEQHFIQGGNNRIILATDGDLNIGMTSEKELEDLITAKKESGIFLSVLGFGTGNIKDNKMEILADKGNGNYAYIDNLQEARKVLVEEMAATLLTVCRDVKFQVEFNPAVVESYRLLGYENRALASEDFHDDTKDAGEIGAGHSVTVLYEIIRKGAGNHAKLEKGIEDLKYGREYKEALAADRTAAGQYPSASMKEWLTLSIRYKRPAEKCSSILEYPVGYESYTSTPDEDFVFAAAVAEFGLLASHSRYPENASLYHVDKMLRSLELTDAYRKEFVELANTLYSTVR
jgi:Ca-activated chloride channel family protein